MKGTRFSRIVHNPRIREAILILVGASGAVWSTGCESHPPCGNLGQRIMERSGLDSPFELRPKMNSCEVIVSGTPEIGEFRIWVPEGISSNTGTCCVYPTGGPWVHDGSTLTQDVQKDGLGMVPDPPECSIVWQSTVTARESSIDFGITLTNTGETAIEKAGAAICVKLNQAKWWSANDTYVLSGGKVRALSDFEWPQDQYPYLQAFLLVGESYDNPFYHENWGFSSHRLDKPIMVSEHSEANVCIAVTANHAYFLHSNQGNPCTDVMLAFGDIAPGETAESCGRILILEGKARDMLTQP